MTNLALDDGLLDEALKIGGKATKKDTVTEALQEYIARRKQARIADLFGTHRLRSQVRLQEAAAPAVKVLVDTFSRYAKVIPLVLHPPVS